MRTWLATAAFQGRRVASGFQKQTFALATLLTVGAASAFAQPTPEPGGGEAGLNLPDLSQVSFFNGAIDGHRLLMIGIVFCLFGLGFGTLVKNQVAAILLTIGGTLEAQNAGGRRIDGAGRACDGRACDGEPLRIECEHCWPISPA